MMIVIAYDICTAKRGGAKRLRKVERICSDWGVAVQDYVYECLLHADQLRMLENELHGAIDSSVDSIRIYRLGRRYDSGITVIGKAPDIWDRSTFVIG